MVMLRFAHCRLSIGLRVVGYRLSVVCAAGAWSKSKAGLRELESRKQPTTDNR